MVWPTMMRFDWFFCNEFEADLHEELEELSVPKKSSASDFAQRMHVGGGQSSLPKTICLRFCRKELEDFAFPKNHMCFNLDLYRCIPSASKPGSLFWQTDSSHVDILGWTIWTQKNHQRREAQRKTDGHTCIHVYIHTYIPLLQGIWAWTLSLASLSPASSSAIWTSFKGLKKSLINTWFLQNLPTFHHPLYFHVFHKFLQTLDS